MQPEGLPVDLFTSGEARWLGVSAGKLPEQPRTLLVSVPYALKANDAELLGGKPASAYALAQPAGTSTSVGTSTAGATALGGAASSELATPGKPKSGAKPNFTETGNANYIPMYSDASLDLGNSVMYQSGGLVGVGTATPGVALDVYGSNAGLRLSGTGTHQVTVTGATSGRLGQDAAGFFFASDSKGAAIRFATNNGALNEWMRITSAGNVGIGTTTPASTLTVSGSGSFTGNTSAVNSSILTATQAGSTSTPPTGSASTLPPAAVYGNATATSNFAAGVIGSSWSSSGFGVMGVTQSATNDSGPAVLAVSLATTGVSKALVASVNSPNGVVATLNALAAGATLINGTVGPSGSRSTVFLVDSSGNVSTSGNVSMGGNLNVTGAITAGTKDFKIDDPLDPDRKFLYHASVESSEMMNMYTGNVITDAHGDAVVELPAWFQALNRDFRYELTVIGQFAQAIVAQEIQNNRFTIKTDKADVKVSWQVTGVRHDAYAEAHPLQVEVDKAERAR
jgi:hypothetical protein